MFELLTLVLFAWLFFHAVRLTFKLTWGFAKVAAVVLLILAMPVLAGCLLFAGGILLLVPVAIIATAWGILRACV
jgi:hypothetical protein